ncbi:DUF6503 family protein [Pontibacter sp. CAU 1760]
MNKILYLFLAVLLGTACRPNEATDTTAPTDYPAYFQEVLEAHGGLAKWQELSSMQFELYNNSNGKTETHLIDTNTRKDLVQGDGYTVGYDGSEVWVSPTLAAFEGKSPRFYHNLYFYFYAMPFVLADPGVQYSQEENLMIQGKTYNVIGISFGENVGDTPEDRYRVLVDPATKRIEWLLYTITYFDKNAADEFKAMKFDGYEQHHGMIFPTKLTSYAFENDQLGQERYYSQIKNLRLSQEQPEVSRFEKPQQAEVDTVTF